MGTRYFWAQIAARAMPLASAVRTMVMSPTSKNLANSSAMASISRISTRWLRKPSTLMMLPGSTLPSLRMRSFSSCIVSPHPLILICGLLLCQSGRRPFRRPQRVLQSCRSSSRPGRPSALLLNMSTILPYFCPAGNCGFRQISIFPYGRGDCLTYRSGSPGFSGSTPPRSRWWSPRSPPHRPCSATRGWAGT